MYKNWRGLVRPKFLEVDRESLTECYGKFEAKPLERGYGVTVGNALRRTLLSSLQGAAVTSVKMENVLHEFSTIAGIKEDVANIILNLKGLKIRHHGTDTETMTIDEKGEKIVTAADIKASQNIEILNPDHHIATLGAEGKLKFEMTVGLGKGYMPSERNKTDDMPVGTIPTDSVFSPITRVNFNVTNARVGQRTDYDRLVLEVWTNGSVKPDDALAYAAKILKEQLQIFINFDEAFEPEEIEVTEVGPKLNPNLYRKVDELELSVRSANCLQNANIKFIGELCQKSESEMLKTKNFGRKSLNEIKEILSSMGLSLGMQLDGFVVSDAEKYRPKDIE